MVLILTLVPKEHVLFLVVYLSGDQYLEESSFLGSMEILSHKVEKTSELMEPVCLVTTDKELKLEELSTDTKDQFEKVSMTVFLAREL